MIEVETGSSVEIKTKQGREQHGQHGIDDKLGVQILNLRVYLSMPLRSDIPSSNGVDRSTAFGLIHETNAESRNISACEPQKFGRPLKNSQVQSTSFGDESDSTKRKKNASCLSLEINLLNMP
jgi:hypothetical protein